MNRFFTFSLLATMLLLMAQGCSCSRDNNGDGDVTLATDSLVEQGSFKKSNGEMCHMKVNVVISYPSSYKDSATVEQLQQLYNSLMLKAPGSGAQVKEALKLYAQSLIGRDVPLQAGATRASNDTIPGDFDEIDIDSIESQVKIKVVYNSNNIITFCREETIMKNNLKTSVSHQYVNIDLESMKRIGLSDLFRDDCLDQVTQNLKQQLMSDKDASNEDELNDMGYFNLPNLTVTGNFFFTPDGVTWSYDPSVVAVASVGVPTINIDYDDLKSYKCDNSLLDRF